MDDELREICLRILDYIGDLDEGGTLEIECPASGDAEHVEIPSELSLMLVELRDYLEATD